MLDTVEADHPGCVWRFVSGDDAVLLILSEFNTVNRRDYFITEFYWPDDNVVDILYG